MNNSIEKEVEDYCKKSRVISEMMGITDEISKDVVLKESMLDTVLSSLKKKKYILLLVVNPSLYEKMNDEEIALYVETQLKPWNEKTLVDPYVVLTKNEAENDYLENAEDYPDKDDYFMKFHGGKLNENGEIVSQINEKGLWDSHIIKHVGLTIADIMNMIISEEINFKYILHEGHLCDKTNSESINALSSCDQNSYFIVVECSD